MHVEYQTEVKQLITHKQVKTQHLMPTHHPTKSERKSPCRGTKEVKEEVHEVLGGRGLSSSLEDDTVWPLYVELTNRNVYGCDLVVSATGVSPNGEGVRVEGARLVLEERGVAVDRELRTSVPDVYAAGDVCSIKWEGQSEVWFQVRQSVHSLTCVSVCMGSSLTSNQRSKVSLLFTAASLMCLRVAWRIQPCIPGLCLSWTLANRLNYISSTCADISHNKNNNNGIICPCGVHLEQVVETHHDTFQSGACFHAL